MPAVRDTCAKIGLGFDAWQVDAAMAILAKDSAGLYAADTIVLSIPRQVGKTFLIGALVFADCIVNPGTTVVWTAHRFKVARETFNELHGIAKSPKLAPHIDPDDITTGAGNESIVFRNGSRIVFAARERGAIRGFSKVRRLILDEAQILTESAMSDLAPTMNQATNPQMILMGTPPKPSDPGETFTNLRSEALAGTAEGVVYIEFSAPAGSDLDDREAWRAANPSLYTRTPVKALVRLRKLLSNDDDFRREALGIWDEDGGGRAAISPERWAALADPSAQRGSSVAFGVAFDPEADWAAVAVAWRRSDGLAQVMLADYRPGSAWLSTRAEQLRQSWGGTVLADPSAKGHTASDPVPVSTVAVAHNAFANAVTSAELRWGGTVDLGDKSNALTYAVKHARWKASGDSRVFDRKGSADISPLLAAALALHGLTTKPSAGGWVMSL